MSLRSLPFDDPGEPDTRSGFRFLVWLQRQQLRGQVTAMAWCTLFMAGLAALPAAVGMGVQAVVDRSGGGLALAGGLVLGLGAVIAVSDSFTHRSVVANWITAAVRIQQLLSRKAADLGAVLTRRVAAGEVVAVSTGDVEKIGWFVECLARFAAAVLACVALTVALMIYQPLLGVAVAVAVPVLAVAVLPLLPAAVQRADDQRAKAGRATELASDTVAGLRVLRGIGGEELFLSRYRTASQEVRAAAVRSARMWALITAVQVALPGLFLVFIVWYGVRLVLEGRITVGELVTCYGCITYLLMPLRMFEETAMAWTFSRVSANRAARVLGLRRTAGHAEAAGRPGRGAIAADGPPAGGTGTDGTGPGGTCADGTGTGATGTDGTRAHAERAVATGAEPMHGAVIDRAVISGFAPGGAEGDGFALGGLVDPASGLAVPAGSFTAVVCGDPDAAGRLADRLGGHSPEADAEPSVLLGGVALDALPLDTARSAVLVQDKDPVLLSGTLRELLGVPASGKVTAGDALGAAQCADVLSVLAQTLPGGPGDPMDARLTERGRSLSGGQRQRLALARSLVVDPPVLVLDEPTSAVDAHTEARIAHGLRRVRTGRTTVVFASSPLLLDRADHVVFLREGRAVASGRHRELLRTERAYRAVVTRQEETGDERPPDTAGASGAGGATGGVPGPPHSERARAAAPGGTATAGTADPAAGTGAAGGADRAGPPARSDQTCRTDRESLEESA